MKEFLFRLYVKIRAFLNPVREPLSKEWNEWMAKDLQSFSNELSTYRYLPDPGKGLFDYTASFEHFIDRNVREGRDCDDFARMWFWWGICNGYRAYEVAITTRAHLFRDSHVVTVLEKDGTFTLCNYKSYPCRNTFLKALDQIKHFSPCYKAGYLHRIMAVDPPLETKEASIG